MQVTWFDGRADRREVVGAPEVGWALVQSPCGNGDDLPPLFDFQRLVGGPSLTIGAGDPTVVTYQGIDPPYYVSVGSEQADGTVWFQFGGTESEFLASSVVPAESAAEALRQFFAVAEPPDAIVWREA